MNALPPMDWLSAYSNNLGPMDQTHQEFVTHYNAVLQASPETQIAQLDAFIAHTQTHFDLENAWMSALPDFPPCHRAEHDRVLDVLSEVKKRSLEGDTWLMHTLLKELPAWFDNHVNGMDAALAFHMNTVGLNPGTLTTPSTQAPQERPAPCVQHARSEI